MAKACVTQTFNFLKAVVKMIDDRNAAILVIFSFSFAVKETPAVVVAFDIDLPFFQLLTCFRILKNVETIPINSLIKISGISLT